MRANAAQQPPRIDPRFIVVIVQPSDPLVELLFMRMPRLTCALLFSGPRWTTIEVVALALDSVGYPIGIATLAPARPCPRIVSVWVDAGFRRRGIGTRLALALIDESVRRYQRPPCVAAITHSGLMTMLRVQEIDPRLMVKHDIPGLDAKAMLHGCLSRAIPENDHTA